QNPRDSIPGPGQGGAIPGPAIVLGGDIVTVREALLLPGSSGNPGSFCARLISRKSRELLCSPDWS
ncbi:hypothetical protein, partial [Candidatus Magnetaquicoccus inordinatus]|uniref:hypothetical protein n=1 Tax=Candidatus Magnetaquicoccus inordinatus TaxID=2496818 RepID=UPI001D0E43A9